ncbi:YagK/YfjJ domain-containing protein [Pectobacterium polaris]|uniref:YagK/YfjJ domain-containing protein n=1 Tax=Pectobacterium polaris TaxID=2042057 RepID=UPI001CF302AF|nr:inovirus-type Gp2 protein [Pectobacterium polaris]MCA6952109.1 inovirus Gp2 family protein [Pectobacterium polaris]
MLDGLGLSNQPDYRTLVHFPGNPLYYLDINAGDYLTVYGQLTFRLSYFAKKRTQPYCREEWSFGYSQR